MRPPIRLGTALGVYLVLAIVAWFALSGKMRLVAWIFLAGLAIKTWIAWKQRTLESKEDREGRSNQPGGHS